MTRLELALKLIGEGSFSHQTVRINGKTDYKLTEQQDGSVEIQAEAETPVAAHDPQHNQNVPQAGRDTYMEAPYNGQNYQNYYGNFAGGNYGDGQGMQETKQFQEFVPGGRSLIQKREPEFYMGMAVVDNNRDIQYENQSKVNRNHSNPVGHIVSIDSSPNGEVYGVIFDRGQKDPYFYMGYELSPVPQGNSR